MSLINMLFRGIHICPLELDGTIFVDCSFSIRPRYSYSSLVRSTQQSRTPESKGRGRLNPAPWSADFKELFQSTPGRGRDKRHKSPRLYKV